LPRDRRARLRVGARHHVERHRRPRQPARAGARLRARLSRPPRRRRDANARAPPPSNGDAPSDSFDGLGSLFNNDDVSEDARALETRLGRAAMLGFFFTTVGDVVTRGEGPLEQLRDEETYVLNHINPVGLVQDALGLAGFYVETVLLVWLCLAACFLLAVQNGLANPVRTYSSKGTFA
jgi:photosystem II protein